MGRLPASLVDVTDMFLAERGLWPNRFKSERIDLRHIISQIVTNFNITPAQVSEMTLTELMLYTTPEDQSDAFTGLIRLQVLESLPVGDRIELARRKYGLPHR